MALKRAFLAAALLATPAAAQTPAPLSMAEALHYFTIFDKATQEALRRAADTVPAPVPPQGTCYTLSNMLGSSVWAGLPTLESKADFFRVMTMRNGQIFSSNGQPIPLRAHFRDSAAFRDAQGPATDVADYVTIGCFDNAQQALSARDSLNQDVADRVLDRADKLIQALMAPQP